MSIEVYMPKLGMTMKEGKVVSWLKKEGDMVEKDEALAEIMSEKISNEVISSATGVLEKIIVNEGETVEVGAILAHITEMKKDMKIKTENPENDSKKENSPKIVKEIQALSGIRKVIRERMLESLQSSPQGTMTTKIDMTNLLLAKDKYKDINKNVTVTSLLVKVVSLALKENPIINSTIKDGNLIKYESTNIGVGVATEEGLFVPVIKNVQDKNIYDIAIELNELSKKVRTWEISPEDMRDGTFTISNLGMFDVEVITPIINPPEAGILAVGATKKELIVEKDDSIKIKPMATLSLTADHGIMDGVHAVRFLETIKKIIDSIDNYLE